MVTRVVSVVEQAEAANKIVSRAKIDSGFSRSERRSRLVGQEFFICFPCFWAYFGL